MNNYIVIDNLSSGEFGKVQKIKNKFTNKLLAVKIEPVKNNTLEYEAKIYTYLSGISNIPQIKSYKNDGINNYLFMELMDYDLKYFKKNNFSQLSVYKNTCREIIIKLIDIFKNIHNKNIIHRDVKPDNICFHNNHIKIIDFGLSKLIDDKKTTINSIIGTPNYVSLRILNYCEPTRLDELESLCYIFIYLILDDILLDKYFSETNLSKKKPETINKYIYHLELQQIITKHITFCRETTVENIDIYTLLKDLYKNKHL